MITTPREIRIIDETLIRRRIFRISADCYEEHISLLLLDDQQ